MPITKEQLVKSLLESGDDPSQYDLDATVAEHNKSSVPTPPTNDQMSVGRAALVTGRRSIIPTLAGGLGAAGLAALAPVTGGSSLLPLILGAGGALGGSMIGSYGQEKALQGIESPEDYAAGQKELDQAHEQHPLVSLGAETAPLLLQAGISPSGLLKAGKGVGRLLLGKTLAEGEGQALTHAGVNAAVGGGTDIASQLINGDEFSPTRALEATATGALFNKPQLLGKTRAFGYRGEPTPQPPVDHPVAKDFYNYQQEQANPQNRPLSPLDFNPTRQTAGQRESGAVINGPTDESPIQPYFKPPQPIEDVVSNEGGKRSGRDIPLVNQPEKIKIPVSGGIDEPLTRVGINQEKFPEIKRPSVESTIPIVGERTSTPLKTSLEIANPVSTLAKPEQQSPLTRVVIPERSRAIKPTPLENQLVEQKKIVAPEQPGIAKVEAVKPNPIVTEQQHPTTSVPTNPVEVVKPATDPHSVAKELGLIFDPTPQIGAFRTEGLPPEKLAELEALRPKEWSFTPADGPNKGHTFYVPEGSSREVIEARMKEKLVGEAKANEISTSDKAIQWLESKKAKQNGTLETGIIPGFTPESFKAVWNGAIDIAIQSIKAGKAIHEAINSAIAYLKSNADSTFDETKARAELNTSLAEQKSISLDDNTNRTTLEEAATTKPDRTLPIVRSLIDSIELSQGQTGQMAKPHFTGFYESLRSIAAGYLEKSGLLPLATKDINILHPQDFLGDNNQRNQNVIDSLYRDQDVGVRSDEGLTPEELEIKNVIRTVLDKVVADTNSRGILVDQSREHGQSPVWFQQRIKSDVLNTLLNHPQTPEAQSFRESFALDRLNRFKEDTATSMNELNEMLREFGGGSSGQTNLASQYGPIDKAEGRGLPPEWREKNLLVSLDGYFSRVARRFAYHDNIERSPEMLNALGIKKDVNGNDVPAIEGVSYIGGSEDVKTLMKDIQGNRSRAELAREGVGGIIKSTMMGFGTGAVDFTANIPAGWAFFTPAQTIESVIYGISHFKENLRLSFETGVNARNIGQIEASVSSINEAVSVLKKSRDIINAMQGRNMWEQMTRGMAFAKGHFVAMDNINALNGGEQSGQRVRFMDAFAGPNWREKLANGFSPEEIHEMAAKFVETVQGKYDYRELPAVAVEGSLAPFLSISRWNIGQANNFMKFVINPALKGEITPLLMSSLGAILGGTAVMELRRLMSGRKEHVPEWKEIATSEDKIKPIFYKAAAIADAAGYAGLLGSTTRILGDVMYKNKVQAFTAPLVNAISNSFDRASEAVQAFEDGNLHVGLDTVSTILEDYIQTYRLALSSMARIAPVETGTTDKSQEIELANKNRDLRTYKQLNDYPVSQPSGDKPNIFENQDVHQLKSSQDIGEIQQLVPQVVNRMVAKYKGNPELLGKILGSLKQNSYQTIPNPSQQPGLTKRYLDFITATQGEPARDALLKDYFRQRVLNSIKSGAIPSW